MSFSKSQTYQKLQDHLDKVKSLHLRELFAQQRDMSVHMDHLCFDYSRQRLLPETIELLVELAKENNLTEKIEAMFTGEKINRTENRAVLHTALRGDLNQAVVIDGEDVKPKIGEVLQQIKSFTEKVHSGEWLGFTGKKIRNVIAVGIGGSYLGPEFFAVALRPFANKDVQLHFIANVDGTDFHETTAGLDPEESLVIIISKTFTTAETMMNAKTAKHWIQKSLGTDKDVIRKHFVAVSTAKEKVEAFGIDPANMFVFWDWVGGRFSATSAVGGVPLSLFLGYDNFQEILDGARYMDEHFRTIPLENNLPVVSALIDIWNINFLQLPTRAILPYHQGLAKFAAHCQQVEMESNGKSVDENGQSLDFATGEVVFGEPGTNGQHSFYQLLHQSPQVIPADFIGFLESSYEVETSADQQVSHHEELMTNFFAQPDALAFGRDHEENARKFTGNRPSSSTLIDKLTPFTTGMLLSWLEHRTAVKGFLWGINSFDQFGVELGKVLGVAHRKRMIQHKQGETYDTSELNTSTAKMLAAFLNQRLPSQGEKNDS